jgi:chromosome segregation ATPase
MDNELKQVLDSILDKINTNNSNVLLRLDGVDKNLNALQSSFSHDHDKLIRLEGEIEQNRKELENQKENEAVYGRQLDKKLTTLESRQDGMNTKLIKYGTIITALAGAAGLGGGLF